jgi:putative tryptophan/tyrosine transport system substrate-binding protein
MKRREFIALVAGAVARPRAAAAQQPTKVYRIAVVLPSEPVSQMTETGGPPYWRALFQELRLLGYVEGQNLAVERYSGEGQEQNYARMAHDVVRLKPDLIFAISSRLVRHFKAATTTIPSKYGNDLSTLGVFSTRRRRFTRLRASPDPLHAASHAA